MQPYGRDSDITGDHRAEMSADDNKRCENGGFSTMKARTYDFEVKKSRGYIELPPKGTYIGKILDARTEKTFDKTHDQIVLMIDVTEGDYANRYMDQYNDAKERFPETKFKGTFRIVIPEEKEPIEKIYIQKNYQDAFWAIYQCNPGYEWDWNEKSLVGKKIGFSVRNRFYTYNDKNVETTEIGRLESIEEIKKGLVQPLRDKDTRTDKSNNESGTYSSYEEVTGKVEVPF